MIGRAASTFGRVALALCAITIASCKGPPSEGDAGERADAGDVDAAPAPVDPFCLTERPTTTPWARCFGTHFGTEIRDGISDGAGGVWLTGLTTPGIRAGTLAPPVSATADAYALHVSDAGDFVAMSTFGGPFVDGYDEDVGQQIVLMPGGDVLVGGTYGGDADFGSGVTLPGDQVSSHEDRREIFFARLAAADAHAIWARSVTSEDRDDVISIAADGANGFYAAVVVGRNASILPTGAAGIALVHYDAAADRAWMLLGSPDAPVHPGEVITLGGGGLLWAVGTDGDTATLNGFALPRGPSFVSVTADGAPTRAQAAGALLGWTSAGDQVIALRSGATFEGVVGPPDPSVPDVRVDLDPDGRIASAMPFGPGPTDGAYLSPNESHAAFLPGGDVVVAVRGNGRFVLAPGTELDLGLELAALIVRYGPFGEVRAHAGPFPGVVVRALFADEASGDLTVVGEYAGDGFEIFGARIDPVGDDRRFTDGFVARGRLE